MKSKKMNKQERLNVLYIIDTPSQLYGAELHLVDILKYQKNINHIGCITLSRGILNDLLEEIGIPTIAISWKNIFPSKKSLLRLEEEIIMFSPDIVHSHKPTATYYSSKICRKLQIPHISTIHAIPCHTAKNKSGIKKIVALLYHYKLQYFSELNSSKNIFVSETTRKNYSFLKNKSIVIHNWISPRYISSNSFLPKQQANKFLTIGSIDPLKGTIGTILAFHQIFLANPQATLTIIGDTQNQRYKNEVITLINKLKLNDVILFTGYKKETSEFYKENDVFIYMSKAETFGLVLAEALYFGLPIICNDIEIFQEIVPPENCFLKYPKASISIDNNLKKFFEPFNLKKTSLRNHELACEKYNYESQQNKIQQTYFEVFSSSTL